MRKIFFVVLCLCAWDTAVYAAEPKCGVDNPTGCPENDYCTVAGGPDPQPYCQDCGTLKVEWIEYAWPHSAAGGGQEEGAEVCYQDCNNENSGYFPVPVDHGTWVAKADRAYHRNKCEYELQCENLNDQCDGYHAVSDDDGGTWQCKKNAEERLLGGPGTCEWYLVTYDSTSGRLLSQGVVGCDSSCKTKHFEPYGGDQIVCGKSLGACVSNEAKCVDRLGNCDGTIDGEARWISDSEGWDYSACTCTTTGAVVENGTGSKMCGWSAGENDSTEWRSDCGVEVTGCNSGYCVQKSDFSKCVLAPLGYYGDGYKPECQVCPDAGTTTLVEGAASAAACGMVRGVSGTQFCDNEGCFYLPGTGFIQKAN